MQMIDAGSTAPARSPERQTFHNLDALRGICAVLVALFHAAWPSHFRLASPVYNGWLFVDFFFVLSGFVIAHTYWSRLETPADVGSFAIRRLFRLYPLHIATFVVTAAAVAINDLLRPATGLAGRSFWQTLVSMDTLQAVLLLHGLGFASPSFNAPSWSISTELWTYLLFAGVVIATGSPRRRIAAFLGIGVMAFGAVLVLNHPDGLYTAYQLGFPRCIAGFSLGVLTWCVWDAARWRPSNAVATALLAALAVGIWGVLASVSTTTIWNGLLPPLFAAIILVCASDQGSIVKRLLETPPARLLGRVSYSIYMVHVVVLMIVSLAITRLAPALKGKADGTLEQMLLGDLLCIIYVGIIIVVSIATFHLIESPFRLMGTRLSVMPVPRRQPSQARRQTAVPIAGEGNP